MSTLLHIYRWPGEAEGSVLRKVQASLPNVLAVRTEYCFNVEVKGPQGLPEDQKEKLLWLFTETFEPENVSESGSFLQGEASAEEAAAGLAVLVLEVGPRLAFTTAWSSNCSSMCEACGITAVGRVERSRRYRLTLSRGSTAEEVKILASLLHDRMTECLYSRPLDTFDNGAVAEPVRVIPLLEKGRAALEEVNRERGLGFDDWDLQFYYDLFLNVLKRNPTDVECFDLGQSNSEHSRHWFFGGKMVIDGEEKAETLFQMVKSTLPKVSNSVIAFHDNSSAIQGFEVETLTPQNPCAASPLQLNRLTFHPILTAETHNFPR